MESWCVKTFDTLVIGAGPAGLTTAYQLVKAGRSVQLIEQDPTYVGGISRTVDYKGFLFDIGGHRFFSKSKEVVDLWNEILPDDFIDRPRLSRIYYKGKFYAYPLKAFEALRNLGLIESAACVASYGLARLMPVKAPRTFHQWVRNQFGERLFSIFFKTYTEKVWGMGCDEISADWAAQRIKGLSLSAAMIDGLRRSLKLGKGQGARCRRRQVADRELPLSPPWPRHDVGGRRRADRGDGRSHRDGHHARHAVARRGVWPMDGERGRCRRAAPYLAGARRGFLGSGPGADGPHLAQADVAVFTPVL